MSQFVPASRAGEGAPRPVHKRVNLRRLRVHRQRASPDVRPVQVRVRFQLFTSSRTLVDQAKTDLSGHIPVDSAISHHYVTKVIHIFTHKLSTNLYSAYHHIRLGNGRLLISEVTTVTINCPPLYCRTNSIAPRGKPRLLQALGGSTCGAHTLPLPGAQAAQQAAQGVAVNTEPSRALKALPSAYISITSLLLFHNLTRTR